jgi:hypothetical protein
MQIDFSLLKRNLGARIDVFASKVLRITQDSKQKYLFLLPALPMEVATVNANRNILRLWLKKEDLRKCAEYYKKARKKFGMLVCKYGTTGRFSIG